jgi:hypothetical protein
MAVLVQGVFIFSRLSWGIHSKLFLDKWSHHLAAFNHFAKFPFCCYHLNMEAMSLERFHYYPNVATMCLGWV